MQKTTQWLNPNSHSTEGNKLFLAELPIDSGGVGKVLDKVVVTLSAINQGQLWHIRKSPVPVSVAEGAYMLWAAASYFEDAHKGSLSMYASAVPRPEGLTEFGFVIQVSDNLAASPLPWQRAVSEAIVAQTLLIVLDDMRQGLGCSRDSSEPPHSMWQWQEPTCGWRHRQTIDYGGWHIEL